MNEDSINSPSSKEGILNLRDTTSRSEGTANDTEALYLRVEDDPADDDTRLRAANWTLQGYCDSLTELMDPTNVHTKLYEKYLISRTTLEQVNDFQEINRQKNVRMLQNVQNVVNVLGESGFKSFLVVLEKYEVLVPLVDKMKGNVT
jgi:hypothetical protein